MGTKAPQPPPHGKAPSPLGIIPPPPKCTCCVEWRGVVIQLHDRDVWCAVVPHRGAGETSRKCLQAVGVE